MRTQFDSHQRSDPDIAEAEAILRQCVHCGFCLPACPTYGLLGDERDSPRGRIYLIKNMLETGNSDLATLTHTDRCLSCLSCQTACPSGVDYRRLIDLTRSRIHETGQRRWSERLTRWIVAHLFSRAGLFAAGLAIGRKLRPMRFIFPSFMRSLIETIPKRPAGVSPLRPGYYPAMGKSVTRVILTRGCVQPGLRPQIDHAALRLLNRAGIDVMIPKAGGCCGALAHHSGYRHQARKFALNNLKAWHKIDTDHPVEAIISTTAGCGAAMADYPHLLTHTQTPSLSHDAIRNLAAKVFDITVFLASRSWPGLRFDPPQKPVVIYHAACALHHGQNIDHTPIDYLKQAGFTVRIPEKTAACCGSAGSYSLFQPELASALGKQKAADLTECEGDIVATGNIGCLEHLAPQLNIPIIHTVELLDWASGGHRPEGL